MRRYLGEKYFTTTEFKWSSYWITHLIHKYPIVTYVNNKYMLIIKK